MIKSVPSSIKFPKMEEEILHFWKENDIFKKSLDKTRKSEPYIFYDGPPFATGLPHYGHILTSYIKDTIPRYFTMKGRFVDRTWGWDCHGLPVEYEIEKALKISGKTQIEKYGIDNFNKACRDIVLKYANDWIEVIDRIGRWVDFDRQYKTMDLNYMESVLWVFSELYKKGLVYESLKVVAYCNRCQTPLSNFETGLDDSYREKEDPAITVRFSDADDSQISYLAWTTTPWTLPGNLALAVNTEITYSLVKLGPDDFVWLAADRIDYYKKFLPDHEVVQTCKGEELLGKRYLPLFNYAGQENAFRIVSGDFVDTSAGTGVVHIAPTFGEDDFQVCSREGISPFDPVGLDGRFTAAAPDFAGLDVFEANNPIINRLKEDKKLFRRENYKHNYPHCWRCNLPLIYRSISSWYVEVTRFRDDMIKDNQNINWVPQHIKGGRFGQWLEGARDWAVSRNRFWGAPLPVWKCSECKAQVVPSSLKELEEKSGQPVNDLHRPACDNISWDCPEPDCQGSMKRVPEVLDCWFESGAMPYAQVHFPCENKEWFEENFPASFIVEYIAQTRGWFYTLVVESSAIMNSHPFENSICHGVILAEDGRKMSKSLKNFPDPLKVVSEHGSDALRIYLLSSPVVRGQDIRFSEHLVRESVRRYLIPLWNTFHFFSSYAEIVKGYEPRQIETAQRFEDRHILSELEMFRAEIEKTIEAYDLPKCYQRILYFIETLSGWYVRLNRPRFWVTEIDEDSRQAFDTLYTVLLEFSVICAPFIPFTMDYIYKIFTGKSVHLADWPLEKPGRIDTVLTAELRHVRSIVEGIRGVRERNRTALRQPLHYVRLAGVEASMIAPYTDLIKSQVNIKEINIHEAPEQFAKPEIRLDSKVLGPVLKGDFKLVNGALKKGEFKLLGTGELQVGQHLIERGHFEIKWVPGNDKEDTWYNNEIVLSVSFDISDALRIEGVAKDLNRIVQDLRKQLQLPYDNRIDLYIEADGEWKKGLDAYRDWLIEQTLTVDLYEKVSQSMFDKEDQRGNLRIEVIPKKA